MASPDPGKVSRSGLGGHAIVADNVLTSVSGRSPHDVWAVGYDSARDGGQRSLILHWNGSKWMNRSPGLVQGSQSQSLQAVTEATARNIWAVGNYDPRGANPLTAPLIEHWTGSSWSQSFTPVSTATYLPANEIYGMTKVGPTDLWIVGKQDRGRTLDALIEHWSGEAWRIVSNPAPRHNTAQLFSISGADGNIWAVGMHASGWGGLQSPHSYPLVEHLPECG